MNASGRVTCYLAAPLFSEAERHFNVRLASLLETSIDVYLPQRDGGLVQSIVSRGGDLAQLRIAVFEADLAAIRNIDYLVAVLDGATVDEGVAFELGYAFALRKPCVGLLTDFRRSEDSFRNPMWLGALDFLCSSVEELVERLAERPSRLPSHSRDTGI